MRTTRFDTRNGFTIIELLIVLAVLAVLISLGFVAYGKWRTQAAGNEVKSDLAGLAAGMSHSRNSQKAFPVLREDTEFDDSASARNTSIYKSGANVRLVYKFGTTTKYCVEGISRAKTDVVYHIDSSDGTQPQAGPCVR